MQREIEFIVKGRKYIIEFPNIGKFQQIETMKQLLSKGFYSSLLSMNTDAANQVLDMIDIEAYMTVLCPDLIKGLKCDTLSDLGIEDYLELKEAYEKTFIPFWKDILKLFNPSKKKETV